MIVMRTMDERLRPGSPAPVCCPLDVGAMGQLGMRIGSASTALILEERLELVRARLCALPEEALGHG